MSIPASTTLTPRSASPFAAATMPSSRNCTSSTAITSVSGRTARSTPSEESTGSASTVDSSDGVLRAEGIHRLGFHGAAVVGAHGVQPGVAGIEMRLEDLHVLASDHRPPHAAHQLFALSGK